MKLERIAPHTNAFQFGFDPALLDRLTSIYENVVAPTLDFARLRNGGDHDALHGGGLRFHVAQYADLLAWVSADDVATYREFHQLFEHLELADAVKPLVDWRKRIVMYNGFYVISDGVKAPAWHVDYCHGSHAYTLLTPLYELDADHGQLWYRSRGETIRYAYRQGVGVLVGERFMHSTEPFAALSRPRVLVSLTFGTDRMRYWPALQPSVGSQSTFVVMPCGHQRGSCVCDRASAVSRVHKMSAGSAPGR